MTLSTKSTTTSELPLRCCTTTLTMAYHHSHSRMLYLLPLLFLLLPHPCITAASWIIASLDYHCLFGPQPLFGLPRYFWITAVSTYQTKQSVTPISAFFQFTLSNGFFPDVLPSLCWSKDKQNKKILLPMQCNSLCRVIVLNSSSYHYFSLQSFERQFF